MYKRQQDNRTYEGKTSSCSTASNQDTAEFKFTCDDVSSTTYTIIATGQDSLSGFTYTLDSDGTMATTGLPSGWGTATKGCWITRPGASC